MSEEQRYSVSRIQTFLGCPLKYRFQYLEELPKAFRSSALAFGGSIHASVEWFHRQRIEGGTPPFEAVVQVFDADWFAQNLDPLAFPPGEDRESLGEKGRRMLAVYLEACHGAPPPQAIEEPFEVDLADPETGEVLEVPFRGVVDLVEQDGTVVDLKTAARAMPQGDVERHLQLSVYALAATLRTGRIPLLRLDVLLKTRQPRLERYPTARTLQDLSWTARLLCGVARAIEEGRFYPNPSWRCSECEYFAPCQRWRG